MSKQRKPNWRERHCAVSRHAEELTRIAKLYANNGNVSYLSELLNAAVGYGEAVRNLARVEDKP